MSDPSFQGQAPVVVLRCFAGAREAAGTASVEVAGKTVGDVLAAAEARFGAGFVAVLATSRVWLNGVPAEPADAVTAGDEVAVLPPVSGGCGIERARARDGPAKRAARDD